MNITIIKGTKRHGFFRVIINHLIGWGILLFAFYFNYTFMEGNNFLDVIIFSSVTIRYIAVTVIEHGNGYYKDVPLEKIEEIEAILRGK